MSCKRRRSSARISLVLIGSVAMPAVAGCAQEETRRDVYASKQACLGDWGNSAQDCEPAPAGTGSGGHYYGRPYSGFGSGAAARSPKAIGSSSTSRGGFGSSGRASGSYASGGG